MMENEGIPILIYDNHCYACMKFIKIIDFFAHGKFLIVGHYSDFGLKIREDHLDESALEMFWLINKKKAFGGRAALIPVIRVIFSKKTNQFPIVEMKNECEQDCKTIKEIVKRTTSVLRNSKTLKIKE